MHLETDQPSAAGAGERPPWIYILSQRAAWALGWLMRGIRAEGLEHIPPRGRVIVASNHVSIIDPPLVGSMLGWTRYPRFLAKEELFRFAPLGALFKSWGAIPLDRGRGDVGAIRSALEVLEGEGCLVLFPEGTRARGGRLLRPKPGVAMLAQRTGAPVVPVRVRDTESLLQKGPMRIRFGAPMRYEGGTGREEFQRFADRVMEEIRKL